jgi:hypothetical protein
MPNTRVDEHRRLLERTQQLRQATDDLSIEVTPYDQAQHDELNAALKRHQADLAAHHDKRRHK